MDVSAGQEECGRGKTADVEGSAEHGEALVLEDDGVGRGVVVVNYQALKFEREGEEGEWLGRDGA